MSNNILNCFVDEVTESFTNKLTIVAEYIQNNKNVSCTPEELCELFHITRTSSSAAPSPSGGGSATKAPRTPRTRLSEDEGCKYKFKKGAKEGQACGARCQPGSEHCQTH